LHRATRKWDVVFCAPGQPDHWIRVPFLRRKKTISGQEALVGAADRSYHDESPEDREDRPLDPRALPEGEPELEIESLIIPAVEELHDKHIQDSKARTRKGNAA